MILQKKLALGNCRARNFQYAVTIETCWCSAPSDAADSIGLERESWRFHRDIGSVEKFSPVGCPNEMMLVQNHLAPAGELAADIDGDGVAGEIGEPQFQCRRRALRLAPTFSRFNISVESPMLFFSKPLISRSDTLGRAAASDQWKVTTMRRPYPF